MQASTAGCSRWEPGTNAGFRLQAGTPVDIGIQGLTVTFDFLRPLSAGDCR